MEDKIEISILEIIDELRHCRDKSFHNKNV